MWTSPDYKTFRDTKFGSSIEGQTQVGLGVCAKLPYQGQLGLHR
ncbi:hypothetical protein [Streptomyces milbemycinicus]|uniref:Uncharacterized protein n=1 Tax=Streptomyces milbemycinicus TaxID=476552 RepID=A0ABW8LYW3_9ACTN